MLFILVTVHVVQIKVHELLQMNEGIIQSRELLEHLANNTTVEVTENRLKKLLLLIEIPLDFLTARGDHRLLPTLHCWLTLLRSRRLINIVSALLPFHLLLHD